VSFAATRDYIIRELGSSVGRLPDHIASKINIDAAGCWLWTASKSKLGYGRVSIRQQMLQAHRVVYWLLVGPIPSHLQIDHLCRVPACVNPKHLEPVTPRENTLRGLVSALSPWRDTCRNGHARTLENVIHDRDGSRRCRACINERKRKAFARMMGHEPIHQSLRTHCPKGHAYVGDNIIRSLKGYRSCRACRRVSDKRCYEKRRDRERTEHRVD